MPAADGNGRFQDPPFQELAIGCENGHGPGQQHVREMTQEGTVVRTGRASIVNPARLPPALADNICMFCHQTGDVRVLKPNKEYRDFRPGEPLDDTLSIFLVPPKRESPPPKRSIKCRLEVLPDGSLGTLCSALRPAHRQFDGRTCKYCRRVRVAAEPG